MVRQENKVYIEDLRKRKKWMRNTIFNLFKKILCNLNLHGIKHMYFKTHMVDDSVKFVQCDYSMQKSIQVPDFYVNSGIT